MRLRRWVQRISGVNRLRSDLFGTIHVCYPPITTKFRVAVEWRDVPIPDLPNATAHCAKRTIANLRSPSSLDTPLNEPREREGHANNLSHFAKMEQFCTSGAAGKHYIASMANGGSTMNLNGWSDDRGLWTTAW
jgi:hypothetical protein